MKRRILIIDGLPATGKSFLINKLLNDINKDEPFAYFKLPLGPTRKKLMDHGDPVLSQSLFKCLLNDVLELSHSIMLLEDTEVIVIERHILSTLITMKLIDNVYSMQTTPYRYMLNNNIDVESTVKSITAFYFAHLYVHDVKDVLYINMQYETPVEKVIDFLQTRKECYYFNVAKYLRTMIAIENTLIKDMIDVIKITTGAYINFDFLKCDRKNAYNQAKKFLGGK